MEDLVQLFAVAERLLHALHAKDRASARAAGLEAEVRVAARGGGERLQRLRLLLYETQFALGLPRLAGLGPEAVDELSVVGDLALAVREFLLASLLVLPLSDQIVVIVALVCGDRLIVDVDNVRCDIVEKPVVVGDDDDRSLELPQKLLEPADREDVEVVRRLIEEEGIGCAGERLGEQNPELEPAGECRERAAVYLAREPEALEDLARPGLRGVTVVALEDLLRFGETIGVEVSVLRLDQGLPLDHGAPQIGVPHERCAEYLLPVVEEAVLPKDAGLEVFRYGDGPLRRVLGAPEDVEERGLAGPVRPHEAVALAGVEKEGRVAEEDLAAERLAEAGDSDHMNGRGVPGRVSRTRSCGCSSSRGSRAGPRPPERAACAGRGHSPCPRWSGLRGSRRSGRRRARRGSG